MVFSVPDGTKQVNLMAWQHFTDWLQPGELITKEQRNELLDAFKERVDATGFDILDETALTTVKNSYAVSDKVMLDGAIVKLGEAIRLVSSGASRVTKGYSQVNSDGSVKNYGAFYSSSRTSEDYLLRQAAYALGLTTAAFDEIALYFTSTSSTYWKYSYLYWNILRKAIQMMKWVRFDAFQGGNSAPFSSSYSIHKDGQDGTWTAAKADWYAAALSQSSATGIFFLGRAGNAIRIRAGKQNYEVTIPNISIYANEFAIVTPATSTLTAGLGTGSSADNHEGDVYVQATLTLTVDGVETLTLSPSAIDQTFLIDGVRTGGGYFIFELAHKAWDEAANSSYIDTFTPSNTAIPTSDNGKKNAIKGGTRTLLAAPNFTHG